VNGDAGGNICGKAATRSNSASSDTSQNSASQSKASRLVSFQKCSRLVLSTCGQRSTHQRLTCVGAERAPAAQCPLPARNTAARARRIVSATAYRRTSVAWNLYPTRRTCRARADGIAQTHTTRLVVGWMTSYTKSHVPCCGIEECGDFGESVNSLVLAARTQGIARNPPPPTAPSARSCLSPEVSLDAASSSTYPGFNLSPVRNSRRFAKSCAGGVRAPVSKR
jgi:hypothetical protein